MRLFTTSLGLVQLCAGLAFMGLVGLSACGDESLPPGPGQIIPNSPRPYQPVYTPVPSSPFPPLPPVTSPFPALPPVTSPFPVYQPILRPSQIPPAPAPTPTPTPTP
ncbi:MAG: hypothetical protein ACO1RX_02825 [Candidatus Sericytochromatia bacterium]